mmetsp:Transcript_1853/g.5429  ORF Transcript_1853/g.5429 Transcript_1853/m.5429 type:complete len:488 (+) Transcript_1853:199-1662(+)
MTDASAPLLPPEQRQEHHDIEEPSHPTDDAEIARRLEEGLSPTDVVDFEDLLRVQPDAVISFLADQGTRKLGSFMTEDVEVLPLMQKGTIWTLGSSLQDINYQSTWEYRLATDNYKAKGFPSKVEVEAHVVTLRNAALPDDRGILNPLIGKWLDGSVSTKVFGLPAVHAVISFKWDKWARRVMLFEFICYLVWLIGFQAWIFLFQDENLDLSLRQLAHTTSGICTIVAAIVALIGMAPFLYIEFCTITEYGAKRWLSVWNVLDVLTYVLQIVISVMFFTRWQVKSDTLSILAAIQVLSLWWKVQYFARAFQQMRNTFLNTVVAVIRDVRWFMLLLLVTLWGFAGAYYILYRDEQSTTKFDSPWRALTSVFTIMMGDVDTDLFYNSKKPLVGCIILVVFLVLMVMVLLNLLIAIMSDAAARASDDDGTKFLCSKAELIDELESSLPGWLKQDSWCLSPCFVTPFGHTDGTPCAIASPVYLKLHPVQRW